MERHILELGLIGTSWPWNLIFSCRCSDTPIHAEQGSHDGCLHLNQPFLDPDLAFSLGIMDQKLMILEPFCFWTGFFNQLCLPKLSGETHLLCFASDSFLYQSQNSLWFMRSRSDFTRAAVIHPPLACDTQDLQKVSFT